MQLPLRLLLPRKSRTTSSSKAQLRLLPPVLPPQFPSPKVEITTQGAHRILATGTRPIAILKTWKRRTKPRSTTRRTHIIFSTSTTITPPELSIGTDTNTDNNLHYRYFEKSDKCIWINRREGGIDHKQWIKDPLNHLHDVDAHENVEVEQSSKVLNASSEGRSPKLFGNLIPAALAQAPTPPEGHLQPVQAPTSCVNPHPGNFKYWWGSPIDACNSPMYRQFGDGCTHYQIYNRCANSWDGRIFWTFCRPPPHY